MAPGTWWPLHTVMLAKATRECRAELFRDGRLMRSRLVDCQCGMERSREVAVAALLAACPTQASPQVGCAGGAGTSVEAVTASGL